MIMFHDPSITGLKGRVRVMPAKRRATTPHKKVRSYKTIKLFIVAYAILWVAENALRKWALPSLSDPILIIRDPVAVIIALLAICKGVFPFRHPIILVSSLLGVICFILSLSFGHGNIFVAAFGVRTMLLHLPLIYIIPRVMTLADVRSLSKFVLIVAVPIALLMVLQVMSPAGAWVNRGIEGVTYLYKDDLYRPPAVWSYPGGPSVFFPAAIAAWFVFFLWKKKFSIFSISVAAAIVMVQPIAISRGLVVSSIFTSIVGLVAIVVSGAVDFRKVIQGLALALVVGLAIAATPIFQRATERFSSRIELASRSEGNIGNALVTRALRPLVSPFYLDMEVPVFGLGIGVGTNVGAKLLVGRRSFLAGEGEMDRLVIENGFLLGFAWIAIRGALFLSILWSCVVAIKKNSWEPVILFSAFAFPILVGQWSQPTILGFACLGGGLTLAACRPDV